jgi:hypothetical protein
MSLYIKVKILVSEIGSQGRLPNPAKGNYNPVFIRGVVCI